jgi:hypothetical protein
MYIHKKIQVIRFSHSRGVSSLKSFLESKDFGGGLGKSLVKAEWLNGF